jgi:hypothetical protein
MPRVVGFAGLHCGRLGDRLGKHAQVDPIRAVVLLQRGDLLVAEMVGEVPPFAHPDQSGQRVEDSAGFIQSPAGGRVLVEYVAITNYDLLNPNLAPGWWGYDGTESKWAPRRDHC